MLPETNRWVKIGVVINNLGGSRSLLPKTNPWVKIDVAIKY